MNQLFGQPADVRADSDLGSPTAPPRPLPVGGAEQAFFHLDIKRSLQLHWRLARIFAIAGVAFAVLYFLAEALVLKNWPVYEADSMVYVQPTPSKVIESNQGGNSHWPFDTNTYETYIGQQMMNVTRDDVLASALKKVGDFQNPGESEQKAAQRLARALTVVREGAAYEFSIGARAGNPTYAAHIANDVTAAYLESIARDQRSGDAQRITMLTDERDRISKALSADRGEQEDLNRQLGVASVGSSVPDHFDEDISGTRAELIKARIDHDAAEAKFAALGAGSGPSSAAIDAAADEIVANDAGLVSMKTTLNQRRATLISQMANLTPSHPQYKQDEVELAKINNELDGMMKDLRAKAAARIQLQLQSELQRTAGVESQVNGQLRTLVHAAGGATPKMQRSSDLASDITRLQARFSTVDEQLHNLMLEDNAPAAAYQVTPAVPPLNRSKSGVLRNVVLIILAGIFFGILAAVAKHKLDPKVYIAKDVELILGFAPMAQLPDFNEVSGGVAEEYLLRLASSIEHARKQSHLRSIVFTGTTSGNGVTMLVNRIGEMLQAMGRPTVLVDASGAPAPERLPHRADNTPGLVPVERVSRPSALLQQMAEETETQDESLVLTDTAPLPVSAETEYLARFVDCAIVVIESGKTTRKELREAAATLQRLDVAAVGFVLNRVGLEKADPAFRDSVQAIEKHLAAQGSRAASWAESSRSSSPNHPWTSEGLPAGDPQSKESSARAQFEAELAAAGAAVARFSHPASAEAAACLPSPTLPVPVADSAVRFAAPLISEHLVSDQVSHQAPVEPAASEEAAEATAAEPVAEPVLEPVREPVAEPSDAPQHPPLPAPFAEAARHFASVAPSDQIPVHLTEDDAEPFAQAEEHHSSDENEGPIWVLSQPEPASIAQHLEASAPLHEDAAFAPVQHPEPHAQSLQWIEAAPDHAGPEATKTEPQPGTETLHAAAFVAEQVSEFEPAPEHAAFLPSAHPASQDLAASSSAPSVLDEAGPVEPSPAASNTTVSSTTASSTTASSTTVSSPASPGPEAPWWLSEAVPFRVPNRPPIIWKPARVRMSGQPFDVAESVPAEPGDASGYPQNWVETARAWESSTPAFSSDAISDQPQNVEQEPIANLSSRLSGLRNLLFVLGVKNAHEAGDSAERKASHASDFDLRTERQAFEKNPSQEREAASPEIIGGASPRLVTAPPEFLPPRPITISPAWEDASLSDSASSRQDRRTPYDPIDILPSRKGQYKRT